MKQTSSPKASLWNQLYFVLATLLGLLCVVIGATTLLNTWLTASIFKVEEPRYNMPPQPYVETDRYQDSATTPQQKEDLARWQQDYKQWEEEQKNYSYEEMNRRRNYAWSLALLLTGAPVFALHAPTVFKRAKRDE